MLTVRETTLTTFFPRYKGLDDDLAQLDEWFEYGDITTNPNVMVRWSGMLGAYPKPLISRAAELDVDIVIGYGEKTTDGHYYNTCSYLHAGKEISKYRKVHLPGNQEPYPDPEFIDQLEKRYFEPGDLGFKAFRVPGLAVTPDDGEAIVGMMGEFIHLRRC